MKLSEVWEQVYLLDYEVNKIIFEYEKIGNVRKKHQQSLLDEITKMAVANPSMTEENAIKAIQEFQVNLTNFKKINLDPFHKVLHQNHFWICEDDFSLLNDYVNKVYSLATIPNPFQAKDLFQQTQQELVGISGKITSVSSKVFSENQETC